MFEQTSTLFHSKAEVEDLYHSLSKYASKNGLVISKLEKKKPVPVLKEGLTDQAAELIQRDMVSYYKIPVDYEIKGNFLGFIKFKRDVARSKKSLNFDKETISVVQNDTTGAVVARGELTIVGLPDEFFKIIFLVLFATFSFVAIADNHDLTETSADQENVSSSEMLEDEEVPLNDPFAGNEGQNRNSNIPEEEQEDEMSLYNFKLAGLISGENNAFLYITSKSRWRSNYFNFGNFNENKICRFKID